MTQVTSGELQKEFGRYRSIAHREAVVITNHGRDDLVLLSVDEYKRLRLLEKRSFHISALTDDELIDLENTSISVEASKYNHEMV